MRGVEILRSASSLARGLIKANQKDAARKELEVLAKLGDNFPEQAEVTKLMKGFKPDGLTNYSGGVHRPQECAMREAPVGCRPLP